MRLTSRGRCYLPIHVCLFLLWWFTEVEENHVMEGKVDSKNDLTVVIDAYRGQRKQPGQFDHEE